MASEIEDARRLGPDTLTLRVCPVCGINDRFTALKVEGFHSAHGKKCVGRPVPVKYEKAVS